ncbi:MAG: diguanylate cyclase, partial [Alcaligenaceae bacterium]|nr:diguanylate cyclase [Alcaligenaceae bacterium]
RLWLTATGLVIVWLLAAFALRSYWAQLNNFEQLKIARDELEHLSITDSLTGLANRRRFEDVLAAEYLRLRRDKAFLSIVMVDIDFFKPYNDNYGHVEGDRCLAAVGHAIQKAVRRPQDLAARYGGEEFCCILPDTDQVAAGVVAENIRKAIEALNLPHEYSAVAGHVTASLGVATVRCEGTVLPRQVVNMADERLYQAKHSGRNRIC